jgi:GxxExxY protein
MKIEDTRVNKILDSRGEWTIEVEITSEGIKEKASVPSGKSRGSYEAISLSYEEVQKNLKEFLNDIKNLDFQTSKEFDNFLIEKAGKNKEKLGANFTLGASIAFARVLARKEGLELWEYLEKEYLPELNDRINYPNDGPNKFYPNKEPNKNLESGHNSGNSFGPYSGSNKKFGPDSGKVFGQYSGNENIFGQNSGKLPGLIINIIGGGVHSFNNLDFQEYWLTADLRGLQRGLTRIDKTRINHELNELNTNEFAINSCDSIRDKFEILLAKILNIINKLEEKLPKPLGRNDEGAFCTNFSDNYEPFLYLKEFIDNYPNNISELNDRIEDTRIKRPNNIFELNDQISNNEKLVLRDLSYKLMHILFDIHNKLGTSFKEEQYKSAIADYLSKLGLKFEREKEISADFKGLIIKGLRVDFIIENKIILEVKSKPLLTKEDLRQVLRYLKSLNLPLAIIVNFKKKKIEYKRIINPAIADYFKNEKLEELFGQYSGTSFGPDSGNITFELGADIAANQITKLVNWKRIYEKLKLLDVKYLEDPFKEDEFEKFANLRKQGFKVIGDDLTVTNVERLKIALEKNSVDGVIVKPNQVGTILETFEFVKLAKENNLFTIFSHRSGETNDHWLIDLGIAFKTDFFKIGPPLQGERVAKYNRLREILENMV